MARPEIAETRPRIASGVLSWTSELRMNTMTMSAAPSSASSASDSGNLRDSAKADRRRAERDHRPQHLGADVVLERLPRQPGGDQRGARPRARRASGRGPRGRPARMSRANTGSIAVAPPSSTANRSSVMQPSRNRSRRTNAKPSAIWRSGWRGRPVVDRAHRRDARDQQARDEQQAGGDEVRQRRALGEQEAARGGPDHGRRPASPSS